MKHLPLLLIALLSIMCSTCRTQHEQKPTVYPTTDPNDHKPVVHGIDVSHHNDLQWEQIERFKDLQFLYAKATEGATFQDDKFEHHRQFAHEHGIKFGAYHFLSTTTPIGQQFANFKNVAGRCDCLPMLDIEGWRLLRLDSLVLQQMVDEWIDSCQSNWGVKTIIYCSEKLHERFDLRGCPWWADMLICRNANNVHTEEPKGDYTIWQFSVYKNIDPNDPSCPRRPDGTAMGDSVDVNFFRPGLGLGSIMMPSKP